MHFYDEAHIQIKAGKGGDGSVSWHREKYVPKGGPAGGDGGDGGHVFLHANANFTTLTGFIEKKHFAAQDGEKGGINMRAGHRAEDLVLEVPVGTIVRRGGTDEILADMRTNGETITIARGGRGGYGNARFTTAVRQSPGFAELGEPGEKIELDLELKLVADVGIIGVPSAGKSTLISVISNARPKIADYPFTTLVPNLGVVVHRDTSFVASDVPGLIEGAHAGKGLGDAFLRHVERTSTLIHLLDLSRPDPAADYRMINRELGLYSKMLAQKPQLVVVNKIDIIDGETRTAILDDLRKTLKIPAKDFFCISAVTHEGLTPLLDRLVKIVLAARAERAEADAVEAAAPTLYRPALRPDKRRIEITKEKDGFRVTSPRLEQLAVMTDGNNEEAVARLYDVLKKRGVFTRLAKAGLSEGMPVYVGKHRLEFLMA